MPHKDPEKAKAYRKAYRKANPENPEKRRARNKAYREANREKNKAYQKAYQKAYHEANREKRNAQRKARHKANPENPEKKRARNKAYRKANPEKIRIFERRRRAREANAYVPLNKEEKKYELHLELARIALQKETGREYHIDHILPLAHGGIEHPVNWRLMDGKENSSKWAKILPEAVRLAPIQYRLYLERVGPERAREFVLQLANGLGAEVNADTLGKITRKKKLTLEDLFE